MPTGPRTALAAALAAALVCGCLPGYDPCFVPPYVVQQNQLRVLAVRADPPEALVDLDQDAEAALQVRALVVGQAAFSPIHLRGQICLPTDTLRCPDGAQAFVGPEGSDDDVEPSLAVRVPVALVRAARAADPLLGYGGIRVQLDLEAISGAQTSRASKVLLFSPRATTPRPNQPIELDRIDFTIDGKPAGFGAPGLSLGVDVGATYGLRPRLYTLPDGGSPLEEYQVTDLSGRAVTLREQVSYSFFTSGSSLFGDLEGAGSGVPVGVYLQGGDVADEPAQGVPEPPNGLVRFTPVKASIGELYVVARESRGSVAWLAVGVGANDGRTCGFNPVTGQIIKCPALFFGCE